MATANNSWIHSAAGVYGVEPLLAHMERNESDLRDECSKCGATSYQGGYCFRCGTYRPSKHNFRDEELDAACFMEGDFAQRMRIFYDEQDAPGEFAEPDSLTDPNYRPSPPLRDEKPRKHKRSEERSEPPPPPSPKPPLLLERPELTIQEKIEMYNRRGDGTSVGPGQRDPSPSPSAPQNVQPFVQLPKPKVLAQPTPETFSATTPTSDAPGEASSLSHFYPYDIVPKPAETVLNSSKTTAKDSSTHSSSLAAEASRSIFASAFLISWILVTAGAVIFGNEIVPSVIVSAGFSVVISLVIDWIAERVRR